VNEEGLKGGRQRGKKALCGVAIEVRGQGSGRLRLTVLPDAAGPSLLAFAKATTAPGAIVHTDGLQSYRVPAGHGYDHRRRPQTSAKPGEQLLPRAHQAIANLKAWMDGTHRGVSDKHLPVYLDEYVFRHNRRVTPMAGERPERHRVQEGSDCRQCPRAAAADEIERAHEPTTPAAGGRTRASPGGAVRLLCLRLPDLRVPPHRSLGAGAALPG
jgi:transposase-like protein